MGDEASHRCEAAWFQSDVVCTAQLQGGARHRNIELVKLSTLIFQLGLTFKSCIYDNYLQEYRKRRNTYSCVNAHFQAEIDPDL